MFVSGMTVFGVFRVLSHRKVLHRCQCRLCEREMSIVSKLGEGSFGAVYTARTTHRASEGVTCVVKRVPVDLDKDINDGGSAAGALARLLLLNEVPMRLTRVELAFKCRSLATHCRTKYTDTCMFMHVHRLAEFESARHQRLNTESLA